MTTVNTTLLSLVSLAIAAPACTVDTIDVDKAAQSIT
jgi:hypothetical protein